ncbi:hypothetical protein NQ318_021762, partial [Aromia moschata]
MTAQKACKLCFKESEDFQVIEENIREILDVLLLKIDFSITEDYIMCESCVDNLLAPFIRTMNSMEVDIVEVAYLNENPGAAAISNSNDAICRLCLERDRCVDLNALNENFLEDIIAKCIPEV